MSRNDVVGHMCCKHFIDEESRESLGGDRNSGSGGSGDSRRSLTKRMSRRLVKGTSFRLRGIGGSTGNNKGLGWGSGSGSRNEKRRGANRRLAGGGSRSTLEMAKVDSMQQPGGGDAHAKGGSHAASARATSRQLGQKPHRRASWLAAAWQWQGGDCDQVQIGTIESKNTHAN